jgi:hypothetical protein
VLVSDLIVVYSAQKIEAGMREGKKLLERAGRCWEDNIKIDFYDTGCKGEN